MKKVLIAMTALFAALNVFAQSDSTKSKPDTIKVGNFVIIKKDRRGTDANTYDTTHVKISRRKRNSNISTNWSIVDIGFANVRDQTAYGSAEANAYLKGSPAFTKDDMKLRTSKTSNVNYWLFMQKVNITKHVLNLKYGLGLEMYNFRYSNNISYREDKGVAYVFRDTVNFSKNKLYAGYITVPFMLNVNTTPGKKRGFSFSAGVSAGYLVGSRNKQISNERGKQKTRANFDLEKWRVAYIAELGLGPIRLYGSYSINPLTEKGLKQYPYAVGIRLSNW